jgi:pimeloyl-ACP methyl ester carboxylesterase
VTLAVLMERSFRSSLAKGLTLTVQCSEGMDFDVDEALARGAGTLVGNYRLEQQLQGCAVWPHEKKPSLGVDKPRALQIPTLLLSGALDPVTPPEYAQDAATLFPNSLHLVVAEGQHGPFDLENSWPCVHQIWGEFLEQGSVRDLDTECIQTLHRPPFLTDAEGFESYVRESLVGS